MNFKDIFDLLDKGMRAQANYQYVVICHLINQRGLTDIKDNICISLVKKNKSLGRDEKHFMNCPVWRVLSQKSIINIEGKQITLNIELTHDQRDKLMLKCRSYFKDFTI